MFVKFRQVPQTEGETMVTTSIQLTAQELVQQKYPNSFVVDDGDWVYIETRKTITENCPHCRQSWKHKITDYNNTLGSGGSESRAWENAAKSLGLI
ncbi:MAG: hypothetical protein HYW77_02350 [Parcubacteria group bacterium]|nr:hypothetical protein [Parcubacteria group bacterium]